jgi:hypothetical protein
MMAVSASALRSASHQSTEQRVPRVVRDASAALVTIHVLG